MFFSGLEAPNESSKKARRRTEAMQKSQIEIKKDLSVAIFDLHGLSAPFIQSNRSLLPWQAALLWEYKESSGVSYPVLQIRETFPFWVRGGKRRAQILDHEVVHLARFAFKEPLFEEVLAYKTSTSAIERSLGPMFLYPFEASLFVVACALAPFLLLSFGSMYGIYSLLTLSGFFLLRLGFLHVCFALSRLKLIQMGAEPKGVFPVLVRLSDREILRLAFFSQGTCQSYFQKKRQTSTRIDTLLKKYF